TTLRNSFFRPSTNRRYVLVSATHSQIPAYRHDHVIAGIAASPPATVFFHNNAVTPTTPATPTTLVLHCPLTHELLRGGMFSFSRTIKRGIYFIVVKPRQRSQSRFQLKAGVQGMQSPDWVPGLCPGLSPYPPAKRATFYMKCDSTLARHEHGTASFAAKLPVIVPGTHRSLQLRSLKSPRLSSGG
ncbi:MAG: hypothetical protein ACJ795_10830, partial [Ktedonobacteraceae bacterium]